MYAKAVAAPKNTRNVGPPNTPAGANKQKVVLGKYEAGKVLLNLTPSSNAPRSGNNGCAIQVSKKHA